VWLGLAGEAGLEDLFDPAVEALEVVEQLILTSVELFQQGETGGVVGHVAHQAVARWVEERAGG
jgi:hypothetical protein